MDRIVKFFDDNSGASRKPLKILLTSDVHRGYGESTHKIHKKWALELSLIDFDILIVAGDLGSSRKEHFYQCLKYFKDIAAGRAFVFVRGNHDFHEAVFNHHEYSWTIKQKSFRAMLDQQKEWFEELSVHHLEDRPFISEGCTIVGWDGWYGLSLAEMGGIRDRLERESYGSGKNSGIHLPGDNDRIAPWIDGKRTLDWLRLKAREDFERALVAAMASKKQNPNKPVIAVTHMPPYFDSELERIYAGREEDLARISAHADILCHGHSHLYSNQLRHGVRVLNAGSDYDKPAFLIIEL